MISLIICTYKRPLAVERLLSTLSSQLRRPDEVLIIDGSPEQETEQVVRQYEDAGEVQNLRYYRMPPQERGLTRQRNYGIARAEGDIVAFLDDDTLPEADYFAEILACFDRHPDAVGVGGYITNEIEWQPAPDDAQVVPGSFRLAGWQRAEPWRWALRNRMGLGSDLEPGWMPPGGHGRPISFLPPDGRDYEVEFLIGAAFAWRREVFAAHRFSPYFAGYGLYEDLDFCIRVSRNGLLYLCTKARLEHHHAPSGRPDAFRYGRMVVRNGWYVWRQRWPQPAVLDGVRWWATSLLLTGCRLAEAVRGPQRRAALEETGGRLLGMVQLGWDKPHHEDI